MSPRQVQSVSKVQSFRRRCRVKEDLLFRLVSGNERTPLLFFFSALVSPMKDRLPPPSLYVPPHQRLRSVPPDYAFHPLPISHTQSQKPLLPTTRYVSAYDDTVSEVAPSLPDPVTCLSFGLTSKFDFFFFFLERSS